MAEQQHVRTLLVSARIDDNRLPQHMAATGSLLLQMTVDRKHPDSHRLAAMATADHGRAAACQDFTSSCQD